MDMKRAHDVMYNCGWGWRSPPVCLMLRWWFHVCIKKNIQLKKEGSRQKDKKMLVLQQELHECTLKRLITRQCPELLMFGKAQSTPDEPKRGHAKPL